MVSPCFCSTSDDLLSQMGRKKQSASELKGIGTLPPNKSEKNGRHWTTVFFPQQTSTFKNKIAWLWRINFAMSKQLIPRGGGESQELGFPAPRQFPQPSPKTTTPQRFRGGSNTRQKPISRRKAGGKEQGAHGIPSLATSSLLRLPPSPRERWPPPPSAKRKTRVEPGLEHLKGAPTWMFNQREQRQVSRS